jgi:hypothetical protein
MSNDNTIQLLQQKAITAYVLTQMSVSVSIWVFGQPALEAIFKEFCQLHNKVVLIRNMLLLSLLPKNAALFAQLIMSKKNVMAKLKDIPTPTVVYKVHSTKNPR